MLKILPDWDWFVELSTICFNKLSTMLSTINLQSSLKQIVSAFFSKKLKNCFCFHGGGGVSTYHFVKAFLKYPYKNL